MRSMIQILLPPLFRSTVARALNNEIGVVPEAWRHGGTDPKWMPEWNQK